MKNKEKKGPFVVDFFVLVLTLVVGLAFVEGVLRFKNKDQKNYLIEKWRYSTLLKEISPYPDLVYEHIPNVSGEFQNVTIRLNTFGMRGPDPNFHDTTRKRILFLGNSNTFGWGVEENQTLPGLIGKKMYFDAQVFNAGVADYNANSYISLFQRKLRFLNPNIVVVQFFIRDVDKINMPKSSFLLENSQLAVMVNKVIQMNLKEPETLVDLLKRYESIYSQENEDFTRLRAAFNKLDILSSEDGFKVILLMTPEVQYLENYQFYFVHKRLEALCDDLGWEFVDLSHPLQAVPPEKLQSAVYGDPNYNPAGYKIMADVLLPYLKEDLNIK